MADMRHSVLLRSRHARILRFSLLRRTNVLPESPVQQHVPLWKMLPSPTTAYWPTGPRFLGPGFFWARQDIGPVAPAAIAPDAGAAWSSRAARSRKCQRPAHKFGGKEGLYEPESVL